MIGEDTVKSIENLHRLQNQGVITEEEFERSKQELLFGAKRPTTSPAQSSPFTVRDIPTPAPDDHISWITLPIKRFADFHGRSSRKEFWMFQLLYVTLFLVLCIANADRDLFGDLRMTGAIMAIIGGLGFLGLFVPLLAVEARRFHDQDRSGWFVLLNFIHYIGVFIVLAMMLIPGTEGDNRFGAKP